MTATADIADGTASDSVPLVLPGGDVAGNPVLVAATVRLDAKDPTIGSVLAGAVVDQGATLPDESFTCADAHSGVATCRLAGGALDTATTGAHTFTVEATDAAGNVSTATFTYTVRSGVLLDAPTVSVAAPTPDGAAGWFVTSPVVVTATATAAAGNPQVDSIGAHVVTPTATTDDTVVNTDGADPFVVARSVGEEGSTTLTFVATGSGLVSDAATRTVRIDTVRPVAGCSAPVLPASADGWYTDAPVVTCAVTDATSGPVSAAPTFTTTVPSGTADPSVSIPWTVADVAGNTTSGSVTVKVDRASPIVMVGAPFDTVTGAYVVGQPADVTCSDGSGSGIATCSATSLDVSSPGNRSLTVTATDRAGNTTTRVVSYSVRAAIAPVVSTSATPATADGANGWYHMAVTVTAEVESGDFALSGPPVLSIGGTSLGSSSTVVSAQGSTTITATAVDVVGNTSTETTTVHRDSVAPSITGVSPTPGSTFSLGQAVTLSYAASDATSGVASCTPSSGSTLPTATAGAASVTITCTDVAGNTATSTVGYTVVAAPTSGWSSTAGTTFTVGDDTNLRFARASGAQLYRNFVWRTAPIPATTATTASGTVRFTTTGTSSARGAGVAVGAKVSSSGAMIGGYTAQFDPGYSCLTSSGGGLLGAFVVQRWDATGRPLAGSPLACIPAPTDLYRSAIFAAIDHNAKFWSLPLSYSVSTSRASSTTTRVRFTVSWTVSGRTTTVGRTIDVATSTLGTRWGLRSWGDVAGTFGATSFRS